MLLSKEDIGKFFIRFQRARYGNGVSDGSYFNDAMRLVNVTKGKLYFSHPLYKCVELNSDVWNDGGWEQYNLVPDTGNGCDHLLPIRAKDQYCKHCGLFIGHLSQ